MSELIAIAIVRGELPEVYMAEDQDTLNWVLALKMIASTPGAWRLGSIGTRTCGASTCSESPKPQSMSPVSILSPVTRLSRRSGPHYQGCAATYWTRR